MREEIIGSARLILGNAMDHIAALHEAACVLTDPPFGIAYQSGHRTDALWSEDTIRYDQDTIMRDGVLVRLGTLPMLVFGSRKAPPPLDTRAVLIWDKGPALGMGALDIPWKPSYEEIYVIGRGFVGARDEGAVLYCPPVQSMAKNGRLHPNEKPVALLRRLLRKMPPGQVADPFMGSCSTAEAALHEGRPFIGCEIDPRYFDIACRRIEQAHRQADLFVPQPEPVREAPRDLFTGEAA